MSSGEDFLRGLACGGGASTIAKTVTAPLERVKILLQTQNLVMQDPAQPKYSGIGATLHRVRTEQGIRSLWRGNLTNCARIMPTYALRFSLFETYQKWFQKLAGPDSGALPLHLQLASGGLSGATTVLVCHPLDLLRTRMAADLRPENKRLHTHILSSGRQVVRAEGVLGLYKGLVISVVEITPYVTISLGGYNHLKTLVPEQYDNVGVKLLLGWVSGLSGSLTCYPMDTVKRTLMLDGSSVTGGRNRFNGSIIRCVRQLHSEHGVLGFYRGCGVNAFKSGPATALTFVANDLLRAAFSDSD